MEPAKAFLILWYRKPGTRYRHGARERRKEEESLWSGTQHHILPEWYPQYLLIGFPFLDDLISRLRLRLREIL